MAHSKQHSWCRWPIIKTYMLWSIFLVVFLLSVKEYKFVVFHRSVGKTLVNEESSRSHFVFTLRISGVNEVLKFSAVEAVTNL